MVEGEGVSRIRAVQEVVEVEGGVSRIRAAQEVVVVEGEAAEFADAKGVVEVEGEAAEFADAIGVEGEILRAFRVVIEAEEWKASRQTLHGEL